MTTNAETLVRRAYHTAEGKVMDVQGFIDLFADDGVINAGEKSYRAEVAPLSVASSPELEATASHSSNWPHHSDSHCPDNAPTSGRRRWVA